MRRELHGLALLALPLALGGCLARAAVDVVTLPVKVVGKGIDAVYVSQADRDRARGKRERQTDERAAKAARKAAHDPG